jgi:hypothetical protein
MSLWTETKLRPAPFRVRFRFAPSLLIWRLKRAQTTDFLKNTLGVQLVLKPLQGAIYGFTFTNDHFWHQYQLLD